MNLKTAKNRILRGGIFALALAAFFAPQGTLADNFGDKNSFFVDKTYDALGRSKLLGTLATATDAVYFYVDDEWWVALSSGEQEKYLDAFAALGKEFSQNIRPELTSAFGNEAAVGPNGDTHLTILVEPMKNHAGGYFNSADGYSKLQVPLSNDRKIVYLNEAYADTPYAKVYLAHEFYHLIDFNQKTNLRNITDENWLNEARADYTSTLLGYDDNYKNSNLEQRVRDFLANSGDSLTEWLNNQADYGVAHLFAEYVVEQYGIGILSDSLKSGKTGIDSIDYALQENGFDTGFSQVFSDWLMAISANDCALSPRYCYTRASLKNLHVMPRVNYLPSSSEATLSVTYNTTYFAGNWQKIVGGKGDLSLEFNGSKAPADFSVAYLLCDVDEKCQVKKFALNEKKGIMNLAGFGTKYANLTLISYAFGKTAGFEGRDISFPYSFTLTLAQKTPDGQVNPPDGETDGGRMAELLAQIEVLKKEIARIQAILAGKNPLPQYSCAGITGDLALGASGPQVKCLQEFLKAQGGAVYPEGIISGNFLALTQSAVIRFQEKYASEILAPAGLKSGTGYVGSATRAKINTFLLIGG